MNAVSPYQQAFDWIEGHPMTGSASAMAKLVLSFWNHDCCFSFGECMRSFDERLSKIACDMAADYAAHGETRELTDIGHVIYQRYPRLWELGQAGTKAKDSLQRQWHEEDRAAFRD